MAKRQGRSKPRERAARAEDVLLPTLENIKDRHAMAQSKLYADAMFESEEALARATKAKQAIRNRMGKLDAHLFIGHGYEFVRSEGEEKFSARKVKRGSKPEDTEAQEIGDLTDTEPEEVDE